MWKGAEGMSKPCGTDRDVDDLIFEDEDWFPSNR